VIISRSVLPRMTKVLDKFVEKFKTNILCSIWLFSENRTAYEIMWKNIVEPDRSQITIRRMRIACWISKATDTYSEYVVLTALSRQQWLRKRDSIPLLLIIAKVTKYIPYVLSNFHQQESPPPGAKFKRRIKTHLPSAGIIRSSSYSPC